MKSILALGLMGGAAYFLWRQFQTLQTAVTLPPGGDGNGDGGGSVVVPTPGGGATATTVELLIQRAGAGPLTADEWNWYYEQLRGVPGPDPLAVWPQQDRSYRMTADEWFSGVRNHGVTGLPGGIVRRRRSRGLVARGAF